MDTVAAATVVQGRCARTTCVPVVETESGDSFANGSRFVARRIAGANFRSSNTTRCAVSTQCMNSEEQISLKEVACNPRRLEVARHGVHAIS